MLIYYSLGDVIMLNCGLSRDRLKQWNSGVKLPLKLTLHRIIIWSPTLTT